MAKIRNEYEVTVTPAGVWRIVHIHGEQAREVAHGVAECYCGVDGPVDDVHTCNAIGRGEEAARRWLKEEYNRQFAAKQKAEGNRVFRIRL